MFYCIVIAILMSNFFLEWFTDREGNVLFNDTHFIYGYIMYMVFDM